MKTTIERYPSILAINFKSWHAQGITCALLDVDSTITPWLGTDVAPEITNALQAARKAGITHIGLVTNSNPKKEDRIIEIARQIKADAYFLPKRFRERKPSPVLIRAAMQQFGVSPQQTVMVGDKFSTDVRAARRAGVAKVAWVDRLGDTDMMFDRLIRRPIEQFIKMAYRPKSKKTNS